MSAIASSSGRIPQGEVIMDFADGGSYIKHKLENAVVELERRRLTKEEGLKASKAMEALSVVPSAAKAEDVEFIVAQMGCSKDEAEVALKANGGDLVKTLIALVQPKKRARSVDGGAVFK
ncbi:hypothetical protein P7C73_g3525, partial [Tremellales sp. Uapishka_1]